MTTRRRFLAGSMALVGMALLDRAAAAPDVQSRSSTETAPPLWLASGQPYRPVVTLNGWTLPPRLRDGVKEYHLVAEKVRREFAPGMTVNCWGYNGSTPGPTLEAVEGDRVRIYVTNRLPEHTTIHWHGIRLPNGMDGVGGLTQPHIAPGETYVYEFLLQRSGTFMYHPHSDDVLQVAMGMMGLFIVHPKNPRERPVDRDFCFLLHNWDIEAGTATPKPTTMTEFNLWTFNSRVFPAIDPLVARKGDRVRVRIGNLSMHDHPIHLHGYDVQVTGTDGGWVPKSAQFPEVTVNVPVGAMRVFEFTADAPGDWPLHCHKLHHTMGPMGHNMPNMLGVPHADIARKIGQLVEGYMAMGETGMAEMQAMQMELPENTLPMMAGEGPYGPLEMGGMFTLLKVREGLARDDYRDPGWYRHPPETLARKV
ncbi:MAG: copper oxidase [Methylophilaceae bacterium]|nr:copper oxidase [Methylophilaceae bacterium]